LSTSSHAAPLTASASSHCRSCDAPLQAVLVDLGTTPLANDLISPEDLGQPETYYPLLALVCGQCFLVQLEEFVAPENIFNDYVYFSSYSQSWLRHAQAYVEMISDRLALGTDSFVVEIASNDGYLLKNFVARGTRCLGIEPARNVADAARSLGVATECSFFGKGTAEDIAARHGMADLIVANNVLAHTPDLNDFIAGFERLLAPGGTITIEAPHVLNLLEQAQFDTIYHEHFSYLSLLAVDNAMTRHGLKVFDVDELKTHGGSLRYYVCHSPGEPESDNVARVREREARAGLDQLGTYEGFQARARRIKFDLIDFLLQAARDGKTVACYGAAAKGNTLLNYCGIDHDLIAFAVDRNPHKQGQHLPGSRIPILAPEQLFFLKPDYLLILPWNLKEEIMGEVEGVRKWGCRFVWAIPELEIAP